MIGVMGAGGAIGGHLVKRLLEEGEVVRAVDLKPKNRWWQVHDAENWGRCDLSVVDNCRAAVQGCEQVYNLAADMGGIGYISGNFVECMMSVLISTHLIKCAFEEGVQRYFYSSSACVYRADTQESEDVTPLVESDAWPADPEFGYGTEKLFSEEMCRAYNRQYRLETHVVRYHNVYGPHGEWRGGREKAPAAICRKVAEAVLSDSGEIEIWGDGLQTRSFMFVDDCVEGTRRLMDSHVNEPINLGSTEVVSINQLVTIVEDIAGTDLKRVYRPDKPQGVRGRNSDNTMIKRELGWEPSTPLYDGLRTTYWWIYEQVAKCRKLSA